MTNDLEARERVRSRLMAMADERFPETWVRITRLELGPPVGFPVQFRIVGPDTQAVRLIAREVEQVVANHRQTRDVQLDWNEPVRTLGVEIDQEKVRALGLSSADVAMATQSMMHGAPLSQIARVWNELEEPVLWRRNRDMAITVHADVKDGAQGVSVAQEIRPLLQNIESRLPAGYRIDVGGAVEESSKANAALVALAPVMLVTILLILMLQLQSFSLMAMVLLTAPLGLIGVVAALLLFQAPLCFVAILGIIAFPGSSCATR